MLESSADRKEWIDLLIKNWVDELPSDMSWALLNLKKSVEYTLVRGGKRFRPLLVMMLGESFGVGPQRLAGWMTAIEMVHTYSLIHDDLPCMDNDFERRGEPTNHVVFGENTALLAGDALLTEAFGVIARSYSSEPLLAIQLVRVLSDAAGFHGMVGGQAIDLNSKTKPLELDELIQMHQLKTGALIRGAIEGAALVCGLPESKVMDCRHLGELVGFAFQLKDDLLDSQSMIESGSIPEKIGIAATLQKLSEVSDQAFSILEKLGLSNSELEKLIEFNLERRH